MLQIFQSTKEVLQASADYFVQTGRAAIAEKGRFTVALSGGTSPKGLFELLASDYRERLDWSRAFFFFGDERYVPSDHPESNALMAEKALFEPLTIASNQIFKVNTTLEPAAAASEYQSSIEKHFAPAPPKFDLILLGLGDDAHTASLFPGTAALSEIEAAVKENFLPGKEVYRITFTAPLINMAAHIIFLVFGNGKARAVQEVLQGEKEPNNYPAQLIKPVAGELTWFLDRPAAEMLKIS